MVNRLLVLAAVTAAATIAGVGVWLGVSGTLSLVGDRADAEAPVLPTSSGTVSYVACPGDQPIGELRGGDRVFLTGRDASGEWVEVRAPEGVASPVWVRAEVVDPDGDADLPEAGCERTEAAVGATTTTTAPEEELPEGESTTTTVEEEDGDEDEPTPTTAPPVTTSTSQPAAPATTSTSQPAAPTTTSTSQPTPPPAIGTISRSHTSIWEVDSPGQCQWYGQPDVRTTISVPISNATSASLSWSVAGSSGSIPMQRSGSTFTAVFGDLPHETVPHTSPYWADATLTVGANGPSGTAHKGTTVRVNDCTPG